MLIFVDYTCIYV